MLQMIKNAGHPYAKKKMFYCTECKNTFYAKPRAVKKRNVCRVCGKGRSMGEDIVINELTERGIKFTREKTFKGLKGVGGGQLRFDFYITHNNKNIIIEIDGEQHYKDTGYFTSENLKENDLIKNKYCEINKIPLYRIKYNSNTNKVLVKLLDILKTEGLI